MEDLYDMILEDERFEYFELETKNKTIGLKPCPFCGGEAEVDCYYDDYFSFRAYCKECGVEAFSDVSKDEVVKKWNKRIQDEI